MKTKIAQGSALAAVFAAVLFIAGTASAQDAPVITLDPAAAQFTELTGISPDGNLIGLHDASMQGRLWSLRTGAVLPAITGNAMVFSPDGDVFASGKRNFEFTLFNADTGEPVHNLRASCPWMNSRETADRIRAFEKDKDRGAVYQMLKGLNPEFTRVRFSPDGTLVAAAGCGNAIYVWSVLTGALKATLQGHILGIIDFNFSASGARIVSGGYDNKVIVWSIEKGAAELTLEDAAFLGFSSNLERFAYADFADGRVRVRSMNGGGPVFEIPDREPGASAAVFSPDGNLLAVVSEDGALKFWDLSRNALLDVGAVAGASESRPFAVTPGGDLIAFMDRASEKLIVRRASDWSLVCEAGGFGKGIDWLEFGNNHARPLLAALGRNGLLRVMDADAGCATVREGMAAPVGVPVFNPTGTRIAFPARDAGAIIVWDLDSAAQPLGLRTDPGALFRLVFDPSGRFLILDEFSRGVILWNLQTGRSLYMTFTISGGWLAAARNNFFDADVTTLPDMRLRQGGVTFRDMSLVGRYYAPGLLARFATGQYFYEEYEAAPRRPDAHTGLAVVKKLNCPELPDEAAAQFQNRIWTKRSCMMCMACGCTCKVDDCMVHGDARMSCTFISCEENKYELNLDGATYTCTTPETEYIAESTE